jgi:hypothetical protein
MIPSQTFFPTNLAARAAFYQNFSTQFTVLGVGLGFTAGDIASVNNDNDVFQFLAQAIVQIEAYENAIRQYRIIITEGDIGDATPQFPANPSLTLPASVMTGMFERLNDWVSRIRVAPGYTDEIGALLGILPSQSDSISPGDVKPTIQAFAAQGGYEFSVVVANRAESDMWDVEIRRAGQEKWNAVKTATGKSVDVEITPTTAGQPEQLQVRVQLKKKNDKYGQPSDAVYVTVNP